jgi:hypothetical protein
MLCKKFITLKVRLFPARRPPWGFPAAIYRPSAANAALAAFHCLLFFRLEGLQYLLERHTVLARFPGQATAESASLIKSASSEA